MGEVVCAVCGNEIRPVDFGGGRVWVCCGKVAHSEPRPDPGARTLENARPRPDETGA